MTDFILLEIIAVPAERSRGRRNPRVVKRKMSNFPTKARAAPAASARSRPRYVQHIQIIAPAVPAELSPAAQAMVRANPTPRRRPKAAPDRCRRIFWLEQVKAWRSGNLARTAYCDRHRLEPRAFAAWVARLRHKFRHRRKNKDEH